MRRHTGFMAIVAAVGLMALTGCPWDHDGDGNAPHGALPSIYPTVECRDYAGLEPCRQVQLVPGGRFPKYLHGVCFDPPLDVEGQCYFNCRDPLAFR